MFQNAFLLSYFLHEIKMLMGKYLKKEERVRVSRLYALFSLTLNPGLFVLSQESTTTKTNAWLGMGELGWTFWPRALVWVVTPSPFCNL